MVEWWKPMGVSPGSSTTVGNACKTIILTALSVVFLAPELASGCVLPIGPSLAWLPPDYYALWYLSLIEVTFSMAQGYEGCWQTNKSLVCHATLSTLFIFAVFSFRSGWICFWLAVGYRNGYYEGTNSVATWAFTSGSSFNRYINMNEISVK